MLHSDKNTETYKNPASEGQRTSTQPIPQDSSTPRNQTGIMDTITNQAKNILHYNEGGEEQVHPNHAQSHFVYPEDPSESDFATKVTGNEIEDLNNSHSNRDKKYANCNYTSMVDPVISSKDVKESEERVHGIRNTTADSQSHSAYTSTPKQERSGNTNNTESKSSGGLLQKLGVGKKDTSHNSEANTEMKSADVNDPDRSVYVKERAPTQSTEGSNVSSQGYGQSNRTYDQTYKQGANYENQYASDSKDRAGKYDQGYTTSAYEQQAPSSKMFAQSQGTKVPTSKGAGQSGDYDATYSSGAGAGADAGHSNTGRVSYSHGNEDASGMHTSKYGSDATNDPKYEGLESNKRTSSGEEGQGILSSIGNYLGISGNNESNDNSDAQHPTEKTTNRDDRGTIGYEDDFSNRMGDLNVSGQQRHGEAVIGQMPGGLDLKSSTGDAGYSNSKRDQNLNYGNTQSDTYTHGDKYDKYENKQHSTHKGTNVGVGSGAAVAATGTAIHSKSTGSNAKANPATQNYTAEKDDYMNNLTAPAGASKEENLKNAEYHRQRARQMQQSGQTYNDHDTPDDYTANLIAPSGASKEENLKNAEYHRQRAHQMQESGQTYNAYGNAPMSGANATTNATQSNTSNRGYQEAHGTHGTHGTGQASHDVTADLAPESTPYRMVQNPRDAMHLKSEDTEGLKINKKMDHDTYGYSGAGAGAGAGAGYGSTTAGNNRQSNFSNTGNAGGSQHGHGHEHDKTHHTKGTKMMGDDYQGMKSQHGYEHDNTHHTKGTKLMGEDYHGMKSMDPSLSNTDQGRVSHSSNTGAGANTGAAGIRGTTSELRYANEPSSTAYGGQNYQNTEGYYAGTRGKEEMQDKKLDKHSLLYSNQPAVTGIQTTVIPTSADPTKPKVYARDGDGKALNTSEGSGYGQEHGSEHAHERTHSEGEKEGGLNKIKNLFTGKDKKKRNSQEIDQIKEHGTLYNSDVSADKHARASGSGKVNEYTKLTSQNEIPISEKKQGNYAVQTGSNDYGNSSTGQHDNSYTASQGIGKEYADHFDSNYSTTRTNAGQGTGSKVGYANTEQSAMYGNQGSDTIPRDHHNEGYDNAGYANTNNTGTRSDAYDSYGAKETSTNSAHDSRPKQKKSLIDNIKEVL